MKTITITVSPPLRRRNPVVRFAGVLKKGGIHQESRKRARIRAKQAIRSALEGMDAPSAPGERP